MSAPWTAVLVLVLLPALLVASYPLQVSLLFARRRRPRPREGVGAPSLSVLVPCRGADEHLAANLAALLGQELPAGSEILVCVESPDDPALAVLAPLAPSRPAATPVRVVITGEAGTDLGKMHNLLGGLARARGRRLVLLDADVGLPDPGYLGRFARDLERPGVGLVTCYPAYGGYRNLLAAVAGMMINADLLGLFATLARRGSLPLANGSCLAVDREVLDAAGGLETLRRQLLMDTALARAVGRLGRQVWLHEEGAPVVAGAMSWRQVRQQSRRWQLAMWRVLPRGQYLAWAYLRSGCVLAVLAAVLSAGRPALVAAAAGSLLTRLLSAWWLDGRYLRSGFFPRRAWLLPLVEAVSCWEALAAPWGRTVRWAGRSYGVDPRGRALAQGPPAASPAARRP